MARPVAYRERNDPKGGGIYCFYPFDSPLDEYCRGIFKIGLAIDFHSRIGNYHTYLPQGVYTSALLQNPTKKALKNKRIYYGKIEKQITKMLKTKEVSHSTWQFENKTRAKLNGFMPVKR